MKSFINFNTTCQLTWCMDRLLIHISNRVLLRNTAGVVPCSTLECLCGYGCQSRSEREKRDRRVCHTFDFQVQRFHYSSMSGCITAERDRASWCKIYCNIRKPDTCCCVTCLLKYISFICFISHNVSQCYMLAWMSKTTMRLLSYYFGKKFCSKSVKMWIYIRCKNTNYGLTSSVFKIYHVVSFRCASRQIVLLVGRTFYARLS